MESVEYFDIFIYQNFLYNFSFLTSKNRRFSSGVSIMAFTFKDIN